MIAASFDSTVYADRLRRAQGLVVEKGLAGIVIGTGPEFAYLTGSWVSSHERLTAVVVTPEAVSVVVPSTDLGDVAHLDLDLRGWSDGEDPHRLVADLLGDGPVGLGSSLTADHVIALRSLLRGEFVLATDVLAELFTVKDAAEIEQLAFAGRAIDKVHAKVPELLRAGRTEAEVAAELSHLILADHDAVDFIIVGSGPNGANPHHSFSDRVLEAGDPVVVDIGGSVGVGYHSDCTRTYVVPGAEPPAEFLEAYAVLQRAQAAGVDAVRPGVTAEHVDRVTRDVIAEAGLGEFYTHRTGHGIGLSLHEQPFIIAGNGLELAEGMAFSVEPGIYKPGEWGMRIEDIVVVSATGGETLNCQPKVLG